MGERTELRWAVLGTGVIANEMAQALRAHGRGLYAVGNRTREKAEHFGARYGVPVVYPDYRLMFSDPAVDVIYLTTPHNTHMGFLEEALSHGKHVLCEKSITLNTEELTRAMALASGHRAVLAEAMTIYHMPLYRELRRRLDAGEFGRLNLLQLNFGSWKEYDMGNRFFSLSLAGGALLDIGVYALSLARLFLDSCPDQHKSLVRFAPSGADETSGILLTNREGQLVTITLSLHSKQPKRALLSCERCFIEVMEYPRADEAVITWTDTGEQERVRAGSRADALWYELEDMERAVRGEPEAMRLPLTADVMALMTALRREWGLRYPEEIQPAEDRYHNSRPQ